MPTLCLHTLTGIPYERLSRNEVRRRYGWDLTSYGPPKLLGHPDFGTPAPANAIVGGILFPQSGYVSDPMLATHNLKGPANTNLPAVAVVTRT